MVFYELIFSESGGLVWSFGGGYVIFGVFCVLKFYEDEVGIFV